MITVNSVEAALYTLVASNAVAVNSGFHVALHAELNTDPNMVPWVGITAPRVRTEPYRAQIDNPWKAVYELQVFVQDVSLENAEKAFDNALRAVDVVLDAYNADRTLSNTVLHIVDWLVEPYEYRAEDQDAYVTYLIALSAEKLV